METAAPAPIAPQNTFASPMALMSRRAERGLDLRWSEWNRAQPRTRRFEDGVTNRRWHHGACRLAASPRGLVRAVDQLDDHIWNFEEGQDRIARPVEARHHGAIEGHLLFQATTHGLDNAALDLVAQPIRIDDLTAIMHDMKPLDRELAGLAVNLHLGDSTDIGAHQLVFDIGEAMSGYDFGIAIRLRALAPFADAGETLQQVFAAWVSEISQAKLQRVDLDLICDLVEKGFVRERVLQAPGRANPGRLERRGFEPMRRRLHIRKAVGDRQIIEHPARAKPPQAVEPGEIGTDQRHHTRRGVRHVHFPFPSRDLAFLI